jgi:DNA segregation ATPase FtsK/SpoIIIE, S-DNA-T family
MWFMAIGLVWARRWPESFSLHVTQRVRGAYRWHLKYRRGFHPAMDGTGRTRSTPSREVYVPRVTAVRSTPVVDTLYVRLLHGQTPTELAQQAEGLRHVYAAHRCTVIEDAPGRVRVVFYARDPLTRVRTEGCPGESRCRTASAAVSGSCGGVFGGGGVAGSTQGRPGVP